MKDVAGDVAGQVVWEMIGRVMSEVVLPVFVVLVISAALVYFIPTIVAYLRRHKKTVAIFFVNLCLGWTAIGWIWALVWAFRNPKKGKGRRRRKRGRKR
jgi:hypothetical protein